LLEFRVEVKHEWLKVLLLLLRLHLIEVLHSSHLCVWSVKVACNHGLVGSGCVVDVVGCLLVVFVKVVIVVVVVHF